MPFSDFVKPPPHTPFTRDFFYSLTFDGLADVRLPVIAPSGNVLHWIHSSDVPTGDTSFRVDVEDFVPHVDDLQEILSSMEREFDSGSRSVYMSVRTVDGLQANFSAHYGKIRIFQAINNHVNAVVQAVELYSHLLSIRSFPKDTLTVVGSQSIFTPIAGFKVTSFPIWELGYLRHEQWVHEDTMNALSEHGYFQRAILSNALLPRFLFPPVTFYSNANATYASPMSVYSSNLTAFRRVLFLSDINAIGFLILEDGHFSSVWIDSNGVFFADSLRRPPPANLMPILSWVFQGTRFQYNHVLRIEEVSQQTSTMGIGSCGIAAHNYIQRHAFSDVDKWEPTKSAQFRTAALVDLVLYHACASARKRTETYEDWALPCHHSTEVELQPDETCFYPYQDYCLDKPTLEHPGYDFVSHQSPLLFARLVDAKNSTTGSSFSKTPVRVTAERIASFARVVGDTTSPRKIIKREFTPEANGGKQVIDLTDLSPSPYIKQESITPSPFVRTKLRMKEAHHSPVVAIKQEKVIDSLDPLFISSGRETTPFTGVKRVGLDVINLSNSSPIRRPFDLRSPSVIEISSDSEVDAELNSDVFGIQSLTRMPPPKDFKLNSDLFGIQTRRRTPQRDFKHLFASLSPDADVEIGNSPTPKAHRKPPTQFGCNASPINIKIKQEVGTKSTYASTKDSLSNDTGLQPALHIKQERLPEVQPSQSSTFVPPQRPPQRTDGPARPLVTVGDVFESLDDARDAVYRQEERRGFQWRIAQTKLDPQGVKKKVVIKCRCSGTHVAVHDIDIDPADHRDGRTVRQSCQARANMNKVPGGWMISRYDSDHNHDRELPPGLSARRPPTKEQRDAIAKIDEGKNLTRRQVADLLRIHDPDHSLEVRQVSNVMNLARKETRDQVKALGGDVATIITLIEEKRENGELWRYRMKLNGDGVLVALWWQSPTQFDLSRRYSDLLLNDDCYNRDMYGYPLDIGIAIDNHGKSRNVWYAFHATEDTEMHAWILQCHLESAGRAPEAFFSDRSGALLAAVAQTMPETRHFICLHHLLGNIADHVRSSANAQMPGGWDTFQSLFWVAYRAVSPDEFGKLWSDLATRFPNCREYLDNELYPSRRQWAWAWIGKEFTAGIRTNGRVESENRLNKVLGGPKKTFFEVFKALNGRTEEQATDELVRVRQSTRQKHPGNLESLFAGPLAMIRTYAGPYALQQSYKQMEASMFYGCDVIQRPSGSRQWDVSMVSNDSEPGFVWNSATHKHMMDQFEDDTPYLSLPYLMREILIRNLSITHVLRITHLGTGAIHHIMILADMRYVCDCGMAMNLGIPCRHYFRALQAIRELPFHIGLVRARWYQDPNLDISSIDPILLNSTIPDRNRDQTIVADLPSSVRNNPLATTACMPLNARHDSQVPPPTQTISSREVYYEMQAAMKPIMNLVQTQEQLRHALQSLRGVQREQDDFNYEPTIRDPPVLHHKGKPRSARLTAAREGITRGGGGARTRQLPPMATEVHPSDDEQHDEQQDVNASPPRKRARMYRCGICHEQGHNRQNCKSLANR